MRDMTAVIDRPTTALTDEQLARIGTAYHEVGHAVLAWHLHAQVRSVSITPEVVNGRTSLGRVDLDDSRLEPRERAMVALAGPLYAWSEWDVTPGPGCVDDLLRVAACGYHYQDRDLVRDTLRILRLHEQVADELVSYLTQATGPLDADWLWSQREGVQDVALAALTRPDDVAQGFRDRATVIVEQLISTPDEGELLLDALREHWRRTAADDWRGRRWLVDTAAHVKDAVKRLPVARQRKGRAT